MSLEGCIFLFSRTTVIAEPWADAGYECYCVDLQHERGERRDGNIIVVGADVTDWWPPHGLRVVFAGAFPPCTDVAVSGAKYFAGKGIGAIIEALRLFHRVVRIVEWCGAPYFIENPVSTISSYWRKPDHTFNPCDFGGYCDPPVDHYEKKTCLWVGNGFVMPQPRPVVPERVCAQGSWVQQLGGSSLKTKNLRSATPPGFARAVFEFNCPKARKEAA